MDPVVANTMSEVNLWGEDTSTVAHDAPNLGFVGRVRFQHGEKEEDDDTKEEGSGGEYASPSSIHKDLTL